MVTHPSFLCGIFMWYFPSSTVDSYRTTINPGYPDALANRHFVNPDGNGWIFSKEFSPSVGTLMYRSLGHQGAFFAEYSFNFTAGINNIIYDCNKYEVSDSSTIFIWAFPKFAKQYNDSIPSLCDLCNGMVQFQTKLTDIAFDLSASNVTVPDISEPKTPPFCVGNVRNRGSGILTEHPLVTAVLVFLCSYLCFFLW